MAATGELLFDKQDIEFINDHYAPIIPVKFALKMDDVLSEQGDIKFEYTLFNIVGTLSSCWNMEKWNMIFHDKPTSSVFHFLIDRNRNINKDNNVVYTGHLSLGLFHRKNYADVAQCIFTHTFTAKTFLKNFDFNAVAFTMKSYTTYR